jgi:hypothetical protein
VISQIANSRERTALQTFRNKLTDLKPETMNQMIPTACGVLDTTGVDCIWLEMLSIDKSIQCLSRPPVSYWETEIADEFIRDMCDQLVRQLKKGGEHYLVRQVIIPESVWSQPPAVIKQVQAANRVLENL